MPQAAAKARWSRKFSATYRKLEALANTDTTAGRYFELLEDGIADLEANYCDGFKMRGPKVDAYCEHLLAGTRWRIIYRNEYNIPLLVLFGEHHLRVSAALYLSGAFGDPSRLSLELGLEDVYKTHAVDQLHLSEAELQRVEEAIEHDDQRRRPQRRCC